MAENQEHPSLEPAMIKLGQNNVRDMEAEAEDESYDESITRLRIATSS